MKFACPHCQGHIECDEAWGGHQISCPICQNSLIVPGGQGVSTPPSAPAGPGIPQPMGQSGPRLAAGATQVRRPAAGSASTRRTRPVRPSGRRSSPLGYVVLAVLLVGLGWAGYSFLPGLVKEVKEAVPANAGASDNRSAGGSGPLGEVNGAMDISDTLDGGSASSPRPKSGAAKQPSTQTATRQGTNTAAKAGH
ncbi:MAG: hypothetical protein C5B50_16225 [Verrucomicrobia bacterium]|nr:MAG: hypothetical protein C5B50_16225 [Verrucomicrobiota bacterium]